MLLLTCATHLMSITIVREPWKYPWLNVVRVICITGVFIVTGLLLSNQNVSQELPFPTAIPDRNLTDSPMFLQAACFQKGSSLLKQTLGDSFASKDAFSDAFLKSNVSNHIQGWNMYLLILLWYGIAIIAEFVRFFQGRTGLRGQIGKAVRQFCFKCLQAVCGCCISPEKPGTLKGIVKSIFALYLTGGVAVSAAAVVLSAKYITDLRMWVKYSRWMKLKDQFNNPEDDATSFGQLVPIFMTAAIAFSFLEMISSNSTLPFQREV
jgi:hypothetical protein